MIRELEKHEVKQVSGGFAPLIGLAASMVGHFTARTVVSLLASRIGLAGSIHGVAVMLDDK